MKTSLCITVFNESEAINLLLKSISKQTTIPAEMVIVDGGSTDRTIDIIKKYQKKDKRIKLLLAKCSRSEGRNMAVDSALNDIIAMTDAGCVADKYWLERITAPFENKNIDIVAGFYKMVGDTPFQKAASVYLGVLPKDFNVRFLPSTRSMAFTRGAYDAVGGFPEDLDDTAEDTMFNYNALNKGLVFTRVKNAVVRWGMPRTIGEFSKKISNYAKGDVKSKIWKHPLPNYTSHNVKVLKLILRYLIGTTLLILSLAYPLLLIVVISGLLFYSFWAFRKSFSAYGDIRVGLWGVILQYVSDVSVMAGFLRGIT